MDYQMLGDLQTLALNVDIVQDINADAPLVYK